MLGINFEEMSTEQLIEFLRGFVAPLKHSGRDVTAEVIEAAVNRLQKLSEEVSK